MPVLLVMLALGAGCSVPPSRLRRDVREIETKAEEMKQALSEEKHESALTKAKEVIQLGDGLAATVFIGDPLRKTVDEALASARDVRREVEALESRPSIAGGDILKEMAQQALKEAAANEEEPKAPPPDADTMTLLASAPGAPPAAAASAPEPADASAGPGGDADLERHRSIVQGDKEGDVSDDELLGRKRRKAAAAAKKDAPKKLRIDENTPPVVVRAKPVTKGKGVAAYFTVVNNTVDFTYVVAVNADFLRESGARLGFANAVYNVEGFAPQWDAILDSQGETLTGDGFPIKAMSGLQLAAVGMKPDVGEVAKVRLEVRMRNGTVHRVTGPTDPDEDKD